MNHRRVFLLIVAAAALGACTDGQRTDLASNGRSDAIQCLQAREGSAELRAQACERRGFAYGGPEYKRGYLETISCARKNGGSAFDAAEGCLTG